MNKILMSIFLGLSIILASCSKETADVVRPTAYNPSGNTQPACLAIDTDGDGVLDCQDPDIDNDNHLNQVPYITIKSACYNTTTKTSCESKDCTWTSQNLCVSPKSCGVNVSQSTCGTVTGCKWDTTKNICDQDDWFPYSALDFKDTDHDGYGDTTDLFPNDPTEWADTKGLGLGDNANFDDDNDGVPDIWDSFSKVSVEYFDADFDSIGNNADFDNDNDGVPNQWDAMPYLRIGIFDIDGDGLDNASDADMDGDGVTNELDAFKYDKFETVDTDLDKIGNNSDFDDDNDGVPDVWDDFPLNSSRKYDSDHDGFANEDDRFPYDSNEWIDTDNDGVGDNFDAFPFNSSETKDTDGDGIGDNSDPDADGDGHYNTIPPVGISQMNVACYLKANSVTCGSESNCSWAGNRCVPTNSCGVYTTQANCQSVLGCGWGGNTCENQDLFPTDNTEHLDYDKDGIGDNIDWDDDNDGIPDKWDDFPNLNIAFVDYDNDGLYDIVLPKNTSELVLNSGTMYGYVGDFDFDNDGTPNQWDDLKFEAAESFDIDHDGVGNNIDPDVDGDGYVNQTDKYPYDSGEWLDNDNDGIGNNIDWDDDNDGAPDLWDRLPFNSGGFSDFDNDGIPDQTDIDLDGDQYPNGLAPTVYNNPLDATSGRVSPYGIYCGRDSNSDKIPDSLIGSSPNNFVCSYTVFKFDTDSGTNKIVAPEDLFVFNVSEWYDYDKDTLGDNEDFDADNDGVPDQWDSSITNNKGFWDIDNDGIPDQIDGDIDGDGQANNLETDLTISPYGVYCGKDTNADGVPDTVSPNNFTCKYRNSFDDFEHDNAESVDTDGDGIGDSSDFDIDGDGVPNEWDAFPLDYHYYWDNDRDGIPNETDTVTPNGINNQTDIANALNAGENLIITSNINITSCLALPEGTYLYSATNEYKISYTGPSNNCMFSITRKTPVAGVSITTFFGNLILDIPENKNKITIFKSTGGSLDEIDMTQLQFNFKGHGIIADLSFRNQLRVVRNNFILNYDYDADAGFESLFKIKSEGATTSDYLSAVFGGNIVFWDISVPQTNTLNFLKMSTAFRKITMSSNVVKVNKLANVTTTAPLSFFDVDFDANSAAPDAIYNGSIELASNRINMNYGKFVELKSTNNSLTQFKISAFDNKIFGITQMGHPMANTDIRDLIGVGCEGISSQNSCDGNFSCTWTNSNTNTGNYCIVNMDLAKQSYSAYYDFKETDVWLNPKGNDYSMFYYPSTAKMASSPALFDSGSNNQEDLNIVQEVDLGLGKIYHVGAIGPVKDSDGDGYRDEIDAYPFDATEWRDTDNDSIGNEADLDDDNDLVVDTVEVSFCGKIDNDFACTTETRCSWHDASKSCRRNTAFPGCKPGSAWQQSSKCCVDTLNANMCLDGSDPYVQDTDGDGLSDYQELYTYNTNPLLKDTDGDGDNDDEEIANHSNPNDANSSKDTDGDGLSDKYELLNLVPRGCVLPQFYTDTDGDGISDYDEVHSYLTNPCSGDTDGDGISDYEEINSLGTNPLLTDTDGDGLSDYVEVNTHHTSPTIADTDGDSVNDGQEIIDGTNPLNSTSFKDTDSDGEADVLDKTPFGVIPYPTCTNTTAGLNACTGTFTNAEIAQEFKLQFQEVNSCYTYSTPTTCGATTRNLCNWDNVYNKCVAKSLNMYQSLTMSSSLTFASCYTVNENSNVTIRSANSSSRRAIVLDSTMNTAAACSATDPFILLASTTTQAAKITIDNMRFETSANMPKIIGTKTSSSKNNELIISNSEFYSENPNGSSILFALDPSKISISKSTFRTGLTSTAPSVATMNSAIEVKKIDNSVLTNMTLSGSIVYCDMKAQLGTMYTNGYVYDCLRTASSSLLFEGNLISLDSSTTLTNTQISSASNKINAWTHIQGNNSMSMKNSRIYSTSKTVNITNGSGIPVAVGVGVRNGSTDDPNAFTWTGPYSSSFAPNELPILFPYNDIFSGTKNASLRCNYVASDTDAQIEFGQVHQAYFREIPLQTYWNRVFRKDRFIQVPGANNAITCP